MLFYTAHRIVCAATVPYAYGRALMIFGDRFVYMCGFVLLALSANDCPCVSKGWNGLCSGLELHEMHAKMPLDIHHIITVVSRAQVAPTARALLSMHKACYSASHNISIQIWRTFRHHTLGLRTVSEHSKP